MHCDINNLKTNLTSFYISLTGDTVKFLFRFKWLVKRGLPAPFSFTARLRMQQVGNGGVFGKGDTFCGICIHIVVCHQG